MKKQEFLRHCNMDNKFEYTCINCGLSYNNTTIRYLCPECEKNNTPTSAPKGVLRVDYDYKSIANKITSTGKTFLLNNRINLLPIHSEASLPKLKTGHTPLYYLPELGHEGHQNIFIKDESRNPTYSFKDRASEMVSAFAKEHGLNTIITASTGNAGSSLAGICASQKQKAIVLLPESAPKAKLIQAAMYGAHLIPVKGNYDMAFDLSIAATKAFGIYNRNTAFNPITIEGKKTVSFELWEDFNGKLPDYIFIPVGDGVIISGIYKGFEDLLSIGLIDSIPTLVAVQSESSANLVNNLNQANPVFPSTNTIADSIQVDIPRNFYMARHFLNKYIGIGITVSDEEIIYASKKLSFQSGLFAEPASAAAYAGYLKFIHQQSLDKNKAVLILLTGSGLKDTLSYHQSNPIPETINADLSDLKKLLDL